jgi:drug/metabolite transporter (DMT)-like permease
VVTKDSTLSPYLAMLLGSLSFAFMAAMAHGLGSVCDWQVIALARTGLALLFALSLCLAARVKLVFLKPRTLWMRSIAGSISLVCTFFAFTRLPVADVLTLTNMFPIWVALLSWPLLKERPPSQVWLAVASGVLGVILIQQPHLVEGNYAVLIALFSSFTTAVAMIGLHRLQHIDVRAIVVHFSAVSLVFCTVSMFLFERKVSTNGVLAWPTVAMLLGVGITATIGQILLTKAFAGGLPAKVSVVSLSQIVFALILDRVLWGRDFNSLTLLGMGLVIAPTAWLMAFRF